MQRVTGWVNARRALEPLDSVLAVRVLDQRGLEISGVPVRWTLPHDINGAVLRTINTRSDSLGLSRATFTPGLTANPQGPVAEVANVGRIDFGVTVKVSTIRVIPERFSVVSGDHQTVGAELRDDAGRILPGGALSWGTTDTSAIHIRREDPARAVVTGKLAGHTNLVAWVGDGAVRGSARVDVRPVIAGRFVTIDGSPVPPMRLEIRAGTLREPLAVDSGGFTKRVPLMPDVDVDVLAAPLADVTAYHPAHLRIYTQRELQNLRIALVPTMWRIDAGTYQGRSIPIDAARAMRRHAGGAPFWRLAPISGRGPRWILGWRESDLPLRLAFNHARSSDPISAVDSVQFWTIASQMARDLGIAAFVPAEMDRDSIRTRVVPIEISGQATEGHTFVSWDQSGHANDGVVLFRHAATLRDAHVVTHELLHLLGFGHSTDWPTVAQSTVGSVSRLTPEDVAYVQLALRLRQLQEQTGARPGLPVARQ